MDRLDRYEKSPSGMDEYMSNYGRHFSKPLYLWAVSMMRGRDGKRPEPVEKTALADKLKAAGVTVERDYGYDVPYAYMMGRADYLGSSVTDEAHLLKFVKDYLDDPDGADTRAFDEFYAKTIALGVPIDWTDVL